METEARDAIHVRRQKDAVPVNGRVFVKRVRNAQCDGCRLPSNGGSAPAQTH